VSLATFRAEREADWARLESILNRVETRSPKSLDDDDLFALPVLYRATLSSLSVARATSLDRGMIDYLEGLSLRAISTSTALSAAPAHGLPISS
jgi:hypothetical protein